MIGQDAGAAPVPGRDDGRLGCCSPASASLFANDFSGLIPEAQAQRGGHHQPVLLAHLFGMLGWGTVGVGVAMTLLIPFLRKLISDKDTPEVDELAPAVVPH